MRKAFTLIELLVVIAIIAILAAILFPVFAQAKLAAKKTVSLSNAKQISVGLMLYTGDYDDVIMPNGMPLPQINYSNPRVDWAPAHCLMQPYIKSYAVWTAANEPHYPFAGGAIWDGSLVGKNLPLKYEYVTNLRTVQAGGLDQNVGIGPVQVYGGGDIAKTRSTSSFEDPSNTISFAEIWSDGMVGILGGSQLWDCDYTKVAGRVPSSMPTGPNVLPPGCNPSLPNLGGYANRTSNHAMVDGSAKSLDWSRFRQNDFYRLKVIKPTDVRTP